MGKRIAEIVTQKKNVVEVFLAHTGEVASLLNVLVMHKVPTEW